MTTREKLQGQPVKYTFYLLRPWPEWDMGGGVGPLFSTGTGAGVGQPVWGGGAWDTSLCIPLTSVPAVKTNLDNQKKKNLEYQTVIISNI